MSTGLIQCTGRWESESGGCEHTDGEDTPFQGLYLESAPSARKGGSRLAALAAKARGGARQESRFVRGRGRAPRERPQGIGARCSASSARPHVSGAPPEQYGRARSRWHRPLPAHGARGERIGRARTDRRRGHSFSRSVFRKCTFGAKRSGSRPSNASRCSGRIARALCTVRICPCER